jgi:hypothetical protein
LRGLPLSMRKTNLARLLARRPDGIFVAPTEQGEIGPDLFRAACNMGLEGLVSKRRDRPYQAGRSKHWIKVKNRKHPAMNRVMEASGPAQSSPTLGDALNAGYLYLEVRCLGCDTHQTVALNIVRRSKSTPVHELERYMRCKDCSQVRGYTPLVVTRRQGYRRSVHGAPDRRQSEAGRGYGTRAMIFS